MNLKSLCISTLLAIISLIIIYAACFYFFDLPLAIKIHFGFANTGIHPFSVLLGKILKPTYWVILGVITLIIAFFLRLKNREGAAWRNWAFFGGSLVVAYIICGIFKVLLGRYRPIEYFEHAKYGFHFLSLKHNMNSSPSGHATEAFAGLFAIAKIVKKSWLTPLLLLVAALIAISRIYAGAHYLGDVIFGAYVGLLTVSWVSYFLYKK